jgi:hypothetical protein
MEQLETDHYLPLVKSIVVLSIHSIYVVFLDPHQGVDDFAFSLPTSKKLMWSSGRDE